MEFFNFDESFVAGIAINGKSDPLSKTNNNYTTRTKRKPEYGVDYYKNDSNQKPIDIKEKEGDNDLKSLPMHSY